MCAITRPDPPRDRVVRQDSEGVENRILGTRKNTRPASALGVGRRLQLRFSIPRICVVRPVWQAVGCAHRRGGAHLLRTQPHRVVRRS